MRYGNMEKWSKRKWNTTSELCKMRMSSAVQYREALFDGITAIEAA